VDELNSALGMLLVRPLNDSIHTLLSQVQNDLFDVGAELSLPGHRALAGGNIEKLDAAIAELNRTLPPLQEFVLPGGSQTGALCHFVRSVCRRAERRVIASLAASPKAAGPTADTNDFKVPYLNRLSDLLFVLARHINQQEQAAERCWQPSSKSLT
jgi:cob(I)alamin adenosyltransferase